jgi:LemA protein
MTGLVVYIVIIAVIVLTGIVLYNSLITLRNRYKNAYSQIDVQLKRRYDLIPNVVETAKGYIKHERGTLEAVIKARNQASSANQKAAGNPGDAKTMEGLMGAEAALTGALGRFFALAENYPTLKANETMAKLMEELSSTENKISFARQAYNDSVMAYNIGREKFPNLMIAGLFNFKEAVLFKTETTEERKPVKVTF